MTSKSALTVVLTDGQVRHKVNTIYRYTIDITQVSPLTPAAGMESWRLSSLLWRSLPSFCVTCSRIHTSLSISGATIMLFPLPAWALTALLNLDLTLRYRGNSFIPLAPLVLLCLAKHLGFPRSTSTTQKTKLGIECPTRGSLLIRMC